MKKIIIAVVAVVVLLGVAGGGAYFYFFKFKQHGDDKTASGPMTPPKPLFFAQLANLVVSVPQTGPDPASAGAGASDASSANQVFVQLSVQFATTDPNAVTSFNALLPIIQADMVSLLMKQNATSLMNPDTHKQLSVDFLAIANGVLAQNQYFKPQNPFTAAYITNIVQQD